MEKSDRNCPMPEASQIQHAVITKLRQLPLIQQQVVLDFVDALQPEPQTASTAALSLRQLAALPLAERHQWLQPQISAIAEDFRSDPALIEFATLDGEDWEIAND
jgi:hypothetical protein